MDRYRVVRQQAEPEPRIELSDARGGMLVLEAAEVVAQYAVGGDTLLVLDEDCPFEEQLHLVLVRDGRVADHLVLGAPYTTGAYREVHAADTTLRFRFAGEDVLRLEVRAEGTRMPRRLAPGARRRGGWFQTHYLQLTIDEEGPW